MAARTRGRPRKGYGPSSALNLPGSTPSRSTSPLEDLDELSEPPVLSGNPTPVPDAPPLAPSVAKYTEEDLQRILKTVLEARAPAPAPITFPEGPRERPLKARFPDVYRGENHLDCYNFCQQCEDHFATAGAKGPNRIPFAASFLRDRINFRWQQHKRKLEAESLAPITWDEFKVFLRRSLGDSRAFVDGFWRKIKRDSQYQQEDVQDWAAHLEHLQAVLKEFDPIAAPDEEVLIRYFRDGLRPSIQAQMDNRNRELDSWDEVLEKAIEAEAKASLQPASSVREMDSRCYRGRRPVKKDETSAPSKFSRDDNREKAKPADTQPSSSTAGSPPSNRGQQKNRGNRRGPRSGRRDGGTPATGVNATEVRKQDQRPEKRQDLSQIKCYNCQKMGHYATKCPDRESKN